MRIAEVAKTLGISADWIRRLERSGSIPQAQRDSNGHRRYTEADRFRLQSLLFARQTPTEASDEHAK